MKFLLIVVAIIAALMVGDAIYPTWDENCAQPASKLGISTPSNTPIKFENGSSRHVNPNRKSDCKYTPHSTLRRAYEWLVH